jgi:hypothetical protein
LKNAHKGNGNVGIGTNSPVKPLSFPPSLGENITLPWRRRWSGHRRIWVRCRLHADNGLPYHGTWDNAGIFTRAGGFQLSGGFGLFL